MADRGPRQGPHLEDKAAVTKSNCQSADCVGAISGLSGQSALIERPAALNGRSAAMKRGAR